MLIVAPRGSRKSNGTRAVAHWNPLSQARQCSTGNGGVAAPGAEAEAAAGTRTAASRGAAASRAADRRERRLTAWPAAMPMAARNSLAIRFAMTLIRLRVTI